MLNSVELNILFGKKMKTIVRTLQVTIPVIFLALAVVGVVRFPFAPIKRADSGFVDKLGHPQTADEYKIFQIWERALTIAGTALAVTAISSAVFHYRKHGTFRLSRKPNQAPVPISPSGRRGTS